MVPDSKPGSEIFRSHAIGFRLSLPDVVVVVVSILIGIAAGPVTAGYSLVVPYVVLHFFLFCNVFRIRRTPELIWSALFLLNVVSWLLCGWINIPLLAGIQCLVTVVILWNEVRHPTYHGIFCLRWNPHLDTVQPHRSQTAP